MKGIVKSFGNVLVNDHVDFSVYPGEVHALLGENGAGKSTLMNILYGMYQPDEGEIKIHGERIEISSPDVALKKGIGMVHQHFMLVDTFSAAENACLMADKKNHERVSHEKIEQDLIELANSYGMDIDVSSQISRLSVGMQQKVEILKLLYIGADILILDEPTSVLAPQECEMLFDVIEKLLENGKSVIFISHKLEEVLRISDRITILRNGKLVHNSECETLDKQQIVELMIGSSFCENYAKNRTSIKSGDKKTILEVENISAKDSRGLLKLKNVSFHVSEGEILGIAGLEGNGQDELMDVLGGLITGCSGHVRIKGEDFTNKSTSDYIKKKVSYIPADRNNVATVANFPLCMNWELRRHRNGKDSIFIDQLAIENKTKEAIESYDIRVSSCMERTSSLSGGNLQKFIVARELDKNPRVLLCSDPTHGIDVKAAHDIRNRLLKARSLGMAIVVSSSDLEELCLLADRLIVLYRGAVLAEVDPNTTSTNELGSLMLGVRQNEN